MNKRILSLLAATVLALSTSAMNIETDRTWYLAGEAMRVSITADDALIAYVELCDMHGLAAGVVIGINGREGTGIIELPADLHSGFYLLSAYTRHSTDVIHKHVAVVNPLYKSEDDDIKWVETTHPDSPDTACFAGIKDVDMREREGHIIKARVKNIYDGHHFRGSQILPSLSIVGKQIHYFEGEMINDSTAIFYTYGIHGKLPLVLSARSSSGVNLPIEMISPFATLIPKKLPHLVFHYNRSDVEARSLDMQRHQMAIRPAKRESKLGDRSDDTDEEVVPLDYDETLFGTKPDLAYNLDEYRQFHTIREVLIEYVECVRNNRYNGVSYLTVRKEDGHYNKSLPTLVLIDGMPVYDTEKLLNYDARRIHYINIYGGQYTFGKGIYNGILSFITRSGRLTNYPTELNMQYLVYDFPDFD